MQVFIVEKNHAGQRLDKFLHKYLPEASKSFIYKMLRKKNITLNGKKAEGKEILQLNDEIKCFFSEETFAKFSGNTPADESNPGGTKVPERSKSDKKESVKGKSDKGKTDKNNQAKNNQDKNNQDKKNPDKKKSDKNKKDKNKSDKKDEGKNVAETMEAEKSSDKKTDKKNAGKKDNEKPATGMSEYQYAYYNLTEENIRIIYEDENILILNKPAGVLTQKAENKDISLNEWMIGYLLEHGRITESELRLFKPSVCNRLDRNTSGLVLCGVSLAGTQKLNEMIKNRTIRKYYRTICIGEITAPDVLEGNLTKDHKKNKVTIDEEGEAIKTAFTPIQKMNHLYTYLEVELITGKTHQIRAHLASIDHALIGDAKYGKQDVNQHFHKKYKLDNHLLHAYRLEFPVLSGEFESLSEMVFLAPLPKEFKTILKDLA